MVIWNILRCDLKHSKTLHRHYTDIKQTLDRYQTDIRHQSRYHDRYEDRYEEWHRHTYKTDIKQKQYRYKGDTKETKRRHKGETKHNIKTDMQYVVHNSSIFTLFLVCWPYFWYVDHIYGMLTIILVFWPYFWKPHFWYVDFISLFLGKQLEPVLGGELPPSRVASSWWWPAVVIFVKGKVSKVWSNLCQCLRRSHARKYLPINRWGKTLASECSNRLVRDHHDNC